MKKFDCFCTEKFINENSELKIKYIHMSGHDKVRNTTYQY